MEHPNHRLLVIDVESNGLYGQPFCVGAVLMDPGGRVLNDFIGRCGIDEVPDDYVEKNVIPALDKAGIREDSYSFDDMAARFVEWHWSIFEVDYGRLTPADVWTYVDAGFPVDVEFLRRLDGKKDWKPPYPLHDVATLIAAAGIDPDVNREAYAASLMGPRPRRGAKHNPLWDAEVSGLCAIIAWRSLSSRST